ncbi:unnamed protein product, partial [Ostreobium quekettii]
AENDALRSAMQHPDIPPAPPAPVSKQEPQINISEGAAKAQTTHLQQNHGLDAENDLLPLPLKKHAIGDGPLASSQELPYRVGSKLISAEAVGDIWESSRRERFESELSAATTDEDVYE